MRLHFNDQIKGGCGTSERGIEESQIFKYLQNFFVPSLHFQKSNPSTADPQRLLNFLSMPIQARMTWLGGSSNTIVQHVCTIVHYCTLPKWAEAQWVIESLRAKAEKSSNFRSMSGEMTWLCSKPLVLVVQEHSHWPTINYHLTLFTSSVLLFCFEHWTPSGLCQ